MPGRRVGGAGRGGRGSRRRLSRRATGGVHAGGGAPAATAQSPARPRTPGRWAPRARRRRIGQAPRVPCPGAPCPESPMHRPPTLAHHPPQPRGATLIELAILLAIGSLLMALAVPNYRDWIADTRLATQAEALAATLTRARSAAIRSGQRVTVCKSADRQTCTAGRRLGPGLAGLRRRRPGRRARRRRGDAPRRGAGTLAGHHRRQPSARRLRLLYQRRPPAADQRRPANGHVCCLFSRSSSDQGDSGA